MKEGFKVLAIEMAEPEGLALIYSVSPYLVPPTTTSTLYMVPQKRLAWSESPSCRIWKVWGQVFLNKPH